MSLRPRSFAAVRLVALALALPLLGVAACGGKVSGDVFATCPATEDCSGEAGIPADAVADVIYADVPPGSCGVGTCSPGIACLQSDGCNTCYCGAGGTWSCTHQTCADAPAECPPTLPMSGTPCTDGLGCSYDVGCGSALASCSGGTWQIAAPACPPPPPCPPQEPKAGSQCSAPNTQCSWPNACGGTDYANCDPSGTWQLVGGSCTNACPTTEPPLGAPCTPGQACSWTNACGGIDTGACPGGSWVLSVGPCTPPPQCPTQEPPIGTGCKPPGITCSWANTCGGTDNAYCAKTGTWQLSGRSCGGVCPILEPAQGTPCTPGAACTWTNACGGTDWGRCPSGTWNLSIGPCAPPPTCPPTEPPAGSPCAANLACSFSNGCGGIDYLYCNAGAWLVKGGTNCNPSCPATKPTTGTGCTPGASQCMYVTDPQQQCTSSCFCSDIGTWACTPSSCSGGGGPTPVPVADAGPIAIDGSFGEAGGI